MSLEWIQSYPGLLPSAGFYQVSNLLPVLSEERLQKITPKKEKYYKRHTLGFLKHFIKETDIPNLVADYDGIYLIGEDITDSNLFDYVYSYIHGERKWIEDISCIRLENIFVFMGPGKIMENKYRSIGKTKEKKYPSAIAGTSSYFLNTDGKENGELREDHRVRAIKHEFRQVAINHAIWQMTGVVYVTDKNSIIKEACAGPGKYYWQMAEIPLIKADVDLLEKTTDFWGWYESQQKKYNCYQSFFENPITKSFYLDYVYKKGDNKYWFEQALLLAKTDLKFAV
ncbi:hypothetical protein COW97_00160 [Candidatus Roizmanbacteria bacterium CG22_combo_CG10-13_8_21_14_all_34_12]|uniref:Uncharacterized protein n=1 Tax=Candidatus Roizmanbacteria bacterium CG22_combo_CG10-13_8_21_14_all_34_12 TaxID=1974860 RepID=A0A2H0C290_9BACT|nr:MAG: hypothetical protein COW97_00160 [Candidatus Roizmanbacteria bacterium CG22_combo_CG10-13_8_21_14_all_34_12]